MGNDFKKMSIKQLDDEISKLVKEASHLAKLDDKRRKQSQATGKTYITTIPVAINRIDTKLTKIQREKKNRLYQISESRKK